MDTSFKNRQHEQQSLIVPPVVDWNSLSSVDIVGNRESSGVRCVINLTDCELVCALLQLRLVFERKSAACHRS